MGLRIRTNVASLNAQRRMGMSTHRMGESMEKLASGFRINKSSDDAAGLAISETMRAKTRSLSQAKRNANDGISLIQTAEGSMNEVSNILIRLRELATQSASDTIGNKERSYTNNEYVQLVKEIDRISNTTEFAGTPLLQGKDAIEGDNMFTVHVGSGDGKVENTDTIRIDVDNLALSSEILGLDTGDEIGPLDSDGDFSRETAAEKLTTIDSAITKIAKNRSYLGAQQSRLGSTVNNLGIQIENTDAAKSRIKDVDFASETAELTQSKILQSAGASVLQQANSTTEIALSLLR